MSIELEFPISDMLDHFLAAKEKEPPGQKSSFWDVFPKDYERVISNSEVWPCFLRNSLSANFNLDLEMWGPDGNAKGIKYGPWENRKNLDFSTILPKTLEKPEHIEEMKNCFLNISYICGMEFVISNLGTNTGSPSTVDFNFTQKETGQSTIFQVGAQDLYLIFYFWQIFRASKSMIGKSSTIVEIGGGFGGMLAKFKDSLPGTNCIIFDLPEVNAVQTYYLSQRYPNARILGFKDYVKRGTEIFEEKFDFLILPGWIIQEMPDGSVDLAINTCSMMEMTGEIIDFYFSQLQRIVRVGGIFSCFNRYEKESIFKAYPYDDRWRLLLSQSSAALGPAHHELIVQRTETPQFLPVKEVMKSLIPFDQHL